MREDESKRFYPTCKVHCVCTTRQFIKYTSNFTKLQ